MKTGSTTDLIFFCFLKVPEIRSCIGAFPKTSVANKY